MDRLASAELTAAETRAVEAFVARVRQSYGDNLEAVWLYGSRARGEGGGLGSDVDLLVITRTQADELVVDSVATDVNLAASEPILLSPQIWTLERLDERRAIRSFFLQEVERDRLVVYERGNEPAL